MLFGPLDFHEMYPGWVAAGRVITYDVSATWFSFFLNSRLQDAPGRQHTWSPLPPTAVEKNASWLEGSGDAGVLGAEAGGRMKVHETAPCRKEQAAW